MEPSDLTIASVQVADFLERLKAGSRVGYENQHGQWRTQEPRPGYLSPRDVTAEDVPVLATLVAVGRVRWDEESWCWVDVPAVSETT